MNTIVIYAFDTPVSCSDLYAPGWDARIRESTGALEMKLFGKAPAEYAVSTTPSPAAGEAAVNFTVSSTSATPVESSSKGGSVKLDAIDAGKRATGGFDLSFSDGALKGTFDAAWCADGHEP
jgi:hypothetical protein